MNFDFRKFCKTFLFGQFLSLLLCGTGVTSGLLQKHGLNTPTAQCFLNYILLSVVYSSYLACRKETERPLMYIIKTQGWKYFLLALVDVEANFLVVKAYSYTTVTSVQVLDSFTIPSVMILSFIFLRVKYGLFHISGAVICLFGIGGLILSDVLTKNQTNNSQHDQMVLGDILCICGAVLYSISNVGEEYIVKKYARTEFLGMVGLFGSFISGIQVIIVERNGFNDVDFWTVEILLPWLLYTVCLFLLYSCMTIGIQYTSATAMNLAILSADFYALLVGVFVFNYTFHVLYFVAMAVIIGGIILYSLKPTESRDPLPVADEDNS
ncbi:hypothetical protein LOTGIDRAFT_137926 [Lottia gigantea]|uniref:Solute carrier family 35 member F2 n=1 Tax=Lottia gigantea TaxID=225164 RepID=V4BAY7_LOTGI|nr:hypothetical protein LOTGIDRAFT_137926 [Lottia gigantea]ESP03152.1 hypothetical protein LOTGIDRAFT_137926 [Lottia gigantea]